LGFCLCQQCLLPLLVITICKPSSGIGIVSCGTGAQEQTDSYDSGFHFARLGTTADLKTDAAVASLHPALR
jgi:hypothetical protein